jgi:hypothetical protein
MSDINQRNEQPGYAWQPGVSKGGMEAAAPCPDTGAGTGPGMMAEGQAPAGDAGGRTSLGAAGTNAIHTMGDIGGSAVGTTGNVVRGAIGATEEVGSGLVGGVAHVATDIVHGVTDLGYEIRNGATGLIGAVGDIGGAAVHTVTNLLVDVVGGVRQVVSAAVGHHDGGTTIQEPREMSGTGRGESIPGAPPISGSPQPERTVRH